MDQISVILVDDEESALKATENLLKMHKNVKIIDKLRNVDDALNSILANKPDIVFLDIEMPNKDGFDLVEELNNYDVNPTIIFITAFNEFAIKAIKYAAFDYLMKPLNRNELAETITRYKSQKSQSDFHAKVDTLLERISKVKKIKFNSMVGCILLDSDDIFYCKASGSYTEIFIEYDKTEMTTSILGKVEEILPPEDFIRINRSVIINLEYLNSINRKEKTCEIKKGEEVYTFQVSRRKIKRLLNMV